MDVNSMTVFVKADLLLHEETYQALREFLNNLSTKENISFHTIDFIEGKLVVSEPDKIYTWAMSNYFGQMLDKSYFIVQIRTLKTMMNLP